MSAAVKLLIFETHPIQYRAPVYKELNTISPNSFKVIFASDFSVRGYADAQFGRQIAWDTPLLEGYPHCILGLDRPGGINRWSGLSGRGIFSIVARHHPQAILIQSFGYQFSWAAYFAAITKRIPIWIRVETQDHAVARGSLKSRLRYIAYTTAYKAVDHAFYIGTLSRAHLKRHGIPDGNLSPGLYCTPNPLSRLTDVEKSSRRESLRRELGIEPDSVVVSFFGKLIEKKNPELLLEALAQRCSGRSAQKITCLFVGTGDLEEALRSSASALSQSAGCRTIFSGFVNQSEISNFYLATDIIVLPSKQMGETWGLVINEALQAGCSAVISDAVGCSADFNALDRVRVFPNGDATALRKAIDELSVTMRSFNWASDTLRRYSIEETAKSLAHQIALL